MSQIIKAVTAGTLPPSVPTQFTTDSGVAVPVANNLNVFTNQTNSYFTNGIHSVGTGSTVTVLLANRATGLVTTTDATITTIITFPLGVNPGVFTVFGFVGGFIPASSSGGSYDFFTSFRTDGVTATEIGSEYKNIVEDASMVNTDIFAVASGNNMLIQVQGVAATTIDWVAKFEYILVT